LQNRLWALKSQFDAECGTPGCRSGRVILSASHSSTPTDSGTDRPVGRRRPDRRRTIIDAAAGLFDARGYHQTSVEEIAEAAGIRKPSLYHYFKSKDELLFWIHEEFVDHLLERHASRLRLPLTMTQRLFEVMADILELMETHRGHVRVFFENYRELPEPHKDNIKRKRDSYDAMVEDLVARGIEAGEFRPVDVRLATLAVFGACNWAYQWYRSSGALRSREVAYVFHELFLHGLAADRDPGGAASAAAEATTPVR
jgi:AcrR family transcriptional regulator